MFRASQTEIQAQPAQTTIAPTIPRYRFTNRHLSEALHFDAWREMVRPLADVQPPDDDCTPDYAVDLKVWDLGRLALARSLSPPARFSRSALQIRNSCLDHWCFLAVKTGTVQVFRDSRISVVDAGSLFVKSLQTPLDGSKGETTALCVFVPRDFCRERVGALDAADESVLASGLGRLLSSYLINLDRQLRWLNSDDIPAVLEATRAMFDACIAPSQDRLAAAAVPINATLLERAKEMVQHNLLSPSLGVDEICRGLGISRSRLYRLFEDLGGVVHYIRSRRLLDAHRVLAADTEDRTIVEIAAERDFLDPADFSRAFKREFGYSPKEARLRPQIPKPPPVLPSQSDGSLGEILNRLH